MDRDDELIDVFTPMTVSEAFWDAAAADVEAMLGRIGLSEGRALVIPRGTGQYAVALAAAGFHVTAVGGEEESLLLARERAEEDGVTIDFVVQEVEDYVPEGKFDLVLNLSSSLDFVHSTGEGGMLDAFREVLEPGGWVVLRMVNLDSAQRRVDVKNWREGPEGMLVLEELEHDWDRGWVSYRWLIVTRGGERFEFQLGHRGYDSSWICEQMASHGFEHVELLGSLDGQPFGADTPVVVYARI